MTSAALIGSTAVLVAGAGSASAGGLLPAPVIFDTPGDTSWEVPADVCTVNLTLEGASGGAGADASADPPASHLGGNGAQISIRVPVVPGAMLSIQVGAEGKPADPNATAADAGDGGFGGGGAGYQGLQPRTYGYSGGGGGGGATSVGASGFPVAVAGGGGGGGSTGAGGDAGLIGANAGDGAASGTYPVGGQGGHANGNGGDAGLYGRGGGGGGINGPEAGGNAGDGDNFGGGAEVPFVWGGGGGGAGGTGTGGTGGNGDGLGGASELGVGGEGNFSGGDGGDGGAFAAGGGGGGLGFSGGGAGALGGGGGGGGFSGGGGGGADGDGYTQADLGDGGGGGGGSSHVSDAYNEFQVLDQLLDRTGDGRVVISWDPSTDGCGSEDDGFSLMDRGTPGAPPLGLVPDGICAVTIIAGGGTGGASDNGDAGGRSAEITARIPVQPLTELGAYVGGRGNEDGSQGRGGGFGGGGANGGGGGGGGATVIFKESSEGPPVPLLVAGAGGGAGLGDGTATGGNAGLLGQDAGLGADTQNAVPASRRGEGGYPSSATSAGLGGSVFYGARDGIDDAFSGGDGGSGIDLVLLEGFYLGGGGGGGGAGASSGGNPGEFSLGNGGTPQGGGGNDGGGEGGTGVSPAGGGGGGGVGFGGGGGAGTNGGGGGGAGAAAGAGDDLGVGGGGGTSFLYLFGAVGTSQLSDGSQAGEPWTGGGYAIITYNSVTDACQPPQPPPPPPPGPATTVTAITSDTPDPSATGMVYGVSGTVTASSGGPTLMAVGDLAGSVTVSVTEDGVQCTDASLTPTGNPDEYGFSCELLAGAIGTKTLIAEYSGSLDFDPSSSNPEYHEVVAVPGPPTGVTVTPPGPGGQSAVVGGTPPQGPPFPTGYQARCVPVGVPFNTSPNVDPRVRFAGSPTLPVTVSGLARGVTYRCFVRARYGPSFGSEVGDKYEGPLSAATATFTVPIIKPAAPTQVQASTPPLPSGQSTTVSFVAGPNDTGATRTFETRCVSSNGGTTRTATGGSPVTVSNLTKGRTYVCSVRATNSAGSSPWAAAPAIIVPPAAPSGVSASKPVSRTTKVSFTAGAGGPPITTFRATCTSSNGGTQRIATNVASPITVTNLTAGKTYTCKVNPMYGTTPGATSAASNSITG